MRWIWLTILVILVTIVPARAADGDLVTYAGNGGNERFNTVLPLSDGTFLVGGGADNLDWLAPTVPRTVLPATGINSAAAGRIAFVLHLSADLRTALRVLHFPVGTLREVRWLRTTSLPGAATGAILLSATRTNGINDTAQGRNEGYLLAKLNNNLVTGVPNGLAWQRNIWATGDHQTTQPWDVGSDGKVVYATGEPFGDNWAAVYRLKADGSGDDIVEQWRNHWTATGEWWGTPASSNAAVQYSGLVFKTTNRGSLRSATQADYTAILPDGNGNPKQGRWPLDYFYNGPFNPADPGASNSGPGYTGYRIGAHPTQRIGAITVDRRTNGFSIGFAIQSTLPGGNPDFEPAVMAMDNNGGLRWWSRLYQETTANSSPDQYVDGLAIDYSQPTDTGALIVLARTHGNNTINLWAGNGITRSQNPNNPGYSFQNQFTGTQGNIHISWLGKLRQADGVLLHSSYIAEYAEGAALPTQAYVEPLLDGWPSHNAGWPNLNTTRVQPDIQVDAQGRVYVLGVGRRSITTSNAHQKMIKPAVGQSAWGEWVRVYSADLTTLAYSSLLSGTWNPTDGSGGDNTSLRGLAPIAGGVLVAGWHEADSAGVAKGNAVPLAALPPWGSAVPVGEAALLARLRFESSTPQLERRVFLPFVRR